MRVIFCFPGTDFTQGWAQSWTLLHHACVKRDILIDTAWASSSSVLHCRNMVLEPGKEVPKKDALPFGGREYDYMMWIDSDMAFSPANFFTLLEAEKDIITGLAPINPQGVGALGYLNNFSPVQYLMLNAVEESEPFEVDFCGFAFLLIKRGVFESMQYPWFRYREYPVEDRIVVPGEDIEWCIRARDLGWKIHAHPYVRVWHEKRVAL